LSHIIALDAMGGDFGPEVTLPAALKALELDAGLELILVGDQTILQPWMERQAPAIRVRLKVVHASQIVAMDESPSQALRSKKDSSMRVAINLVKDGMAQACVSAGNTGALMATSKFVLKTLPGIERPAICTQLPTIRGSTRVLDLGANVESSPEQLFQFAVMGSVLACEVGGIECPKVGLVNIGEEEIKGNDSVKAAAQILAASHLNYKGFIEGDGIYTGDIDVVVCDGFVGNVALKSSEGVAKMITHYLRESFMRNTWTRLLALLCKPVLRGFREKMDPRNYNGASLLGLRGIVIKSHGGADSYALANAIHEAVCEVAHRVPERIGEQLQQFLCTRQTG